MKTLFYSVLITVITLLNGCNENKIVNETRESEKSELKKVRISCFRHTPNPNYECYFFNGYVESECVPVFGHKNFHKLVFYNNVDYGMKNPVVTKYAYNVDEETTGTKFNSSTFHIIYFPSHKYAEEWKKVLYNAIGKKNAEKRIVGISWNTLKFNKYSGIKILTKEKYKIWMKENRKTKIMNDYYE